MRSMSDAGSLRILILLVWGLTLIIGEIFPVEAADSSRQRVKQYWNQAEELYEQGTYDEAVLWYQKTLKAEQSASSPRPNVLAVVFYGAAECYDEMGQLENAMNAYTQALELFRVHGGDSEIAITLNNMGLIEQDWGEYEQAMAYFQEALTGHQQVEDNGEIAITLNNIGSVYDGWGHYDKALSAYEQALAINRDLEDAEELATTLNNIGLLYEAWGKYDTALEYYRQALEFDRELGTTQESAVILSNIGETHRLLREYDAALDSLQQALKLDEEWDELSGQATDLNNIGLVYSDMGEDGRAAHFYEQALALYRQMNDTSGIATALNNLGFVHLAQKQYAKALEYYQQAFTFARDMGEGASMARYLNNIGGVYEEQDKCPEAIPYFSQSVELLETLRKTAPGDLRRDFFAQEIDTYQALISCYHKQGNPDQTFHMIELSRAKRLAEQITGSDEVNVRSLEQIQRSLPQDTAMLIYANTDEEQIIQFFITADEVLSIARSVSDFLDEIQASGLPGAKDTSKETRGLNLGQKLAQTEGDPESTEVPRLLDLPQVVAQYREQLIDPALTRGLNLNDSSQPSQDEPSEVAQSMTCLSQQLYTFLFGSFEEQLQKKSHIIVVPDGVLNFLPFETLIDTQGRYLAEVYHISYAQSLNVLTTLIQRQSTQSRKPLLGFGGAVYDGQRYDAELPENNRQLAYLRRQVDEALNRGGSLRDSYDSLGMMWTNLPGTLQEVQSLREIVPGSEIETGSQAAEARIKALSEQGELRNYKVLHFATHGVVVPEIPELSALVLSQFSQPAPDASRQDDLEDGYLNVREVAQLQLDADFVNLSACETGLGKLYKGEGVLGLTQAFLLAGANGLSVSLWQVSDESTSQFMVALYSLVQHDETLSYAEAMTDVKRRFIRGDFGERWISPYYWAPFVFYGNSFASCSSR